MRKTGTLSFALIAAAWVISLPAGAYNDHRVQNLDSLERVVARWTPDAIDHASTEDLLALNDACRTLMRGYNQLNGEKSIFYARKALSISTREGWTYANSDAYRYLGQHCWAREQYDSALFYYNLALDNLEKMEAGATSPTRPQGYTQEDIDDQRSVLYATLGNLYYSMDSLPRTLEYYARAGEIFTQYGWLQSNAVLWHNIGEIQVDERNYAEAEKAYTQSLEYAAQAGDSLWVACARKGLGRMYLAQGRNWKALRCLHQADEYFADHDREEAFSRKENFEYMSMALASQRKLLAWLLSGVVLLVLLAAASLLLTRRLRQARTQQAETAAVMKEALEDLQNAHRPAQAESPQISAREREILDLLAKGYTTPQIAEGLHLSPETVKWHRKKLLLKFDVANAAELVVRAKDAGVIR